MTNQNHSQDQQTELYGAAAAAIGRVLHDIAQKRGLSHQQKTQPKSKKLKRRCA